MDKKFIKDLKDTLSIKKNVLLIPHSSPDADALGSCLALYHFLRNDHEVHIISPNEFTEILKFLPSSEDIIIYDEEKDKTHDLCP